MKHRAITVTGMILAFAVLTLAQAPEKKPTPSAEHKRFASFLGKWTSEGEMKPGPFGPGGKFSGNGHIEWLPEANNRSKSSSNSSQAVMASSRFPTRRACCGLSGWCLYSFLVSDVIEDRHFLPCWEYHVA